MTDATRRLIYKWISYSALMLFSLLLQTTLLSRFSVFSCTPSLLPFIIATIAMLEGSGTGTIAGLIAGFLSDAIFGGHEGFYTVAFPILAFAICFIDTFMYWKNYGMSILNWIILIVLLSLIYSCVFLIIAGRGTFSAILYVLPGEILATAPFTPFIYIIITRIIKAFSMPEDI